MEISDVAHLRLPSETASRSAELMQSPWRSASVNPTLSTIVSSTSVSLGHEAEPVRQQFWIWVANQKGRSAITTPSDPRDPLTDIDQYLTLEALQALYLSYNRPRDRKIADRFNSLIKDASEEGERIKGRSSQQFVQFFLKNPNLAVPKITLTPDGTVRVRWLKSPENFFAIEFTGRPVVRIVAEAPRPGQEVARFFISETMEQIDVLAKAAGFTLR